MGIIPGLDGDAPGIDVPATVKAGEEFTITIQTAWHDGCARKGSVEVELEGATATVTPFDVVTRGGLCTQQTQLFAHTATLRFVTPGTVEVTIRGRPSRHAGVTIIRRTVVVQ